MAEIHLCLDREPICNKLRLRKVFDSLSELRRLVRSEGFKVDYISTYSPRGPTPGIEKKYYVRISKGNKKIWIHLCRYVGYNGYFLVSIFTRQ